MRAVAYNLVTAVVSMLGVVITMLLGTRVAAFGVIVLPFAAGTYLYIAQAVGVPAVREPLRQSVRAARVGWLMAGFALMAVSAILKGE